jgi:hypothetical protein
LSLPRSLAWTLQRFYSQMLFDPFEEEFYLPAAAI